MAEAEGKPALCSLKSLVFSLAAQGRQRAGDRSPLLDGHGCMWACQKPEICAKLSWVNSGKQRPKEEETCQNKEEQFKWQDQPKEH